MRPAEFAAVGLCLTLSWATPRAAAAADPYDGFEWCTVTAPGNAPVPQSIVPPEVLIPGPAIGRGSVDYNYRIAKTEVSSGQWLEFLNTFSGYSQPHLSWNDVNSLGARYWGGSEDIGFPGPGRHYHLINYPNAANLPVIGFNWHMAALYCNWLNNGKSSDPASLVRGAYDTTTWDYLPNGDFTDALTHETGARYWIPTLDEWLKASFYDPNKNGPDQGGWYYQVNGSDVPPIPGPPGVGETSVGWHDAPGSGLLGYLVPLGAYPDAQSPWGLLDTSGGAAEHVEEGAGAYRMWMGSYPLRDVAPDPAHRFTSLLFRSSDHPYTSSFAGLRIASTVPSPGVCSMCLVFVCPRAKRRRK